MSQSMTTDSTRTTGRKKEKKNKNAQLITGKSDLMKREPRTQNSERQKFSFCILTSDL